MLAWLKSLFASMPIVSVSIPVADAFPNHEELEARDLITDSLESKGFGEFVGCGGGFNQMDFQYRVADLNVAKRQIAKAMAKYMPGHEFEVTADE